MSALPPPPDTLPRSADGSAFFLDVDGTLLDIAARPDAVAVPRGLPAMLERLCRVAGGAVALVSGRDLATLDRLFGSGCWAAAAVHGSEFRLPGGIVERPPPPPLLDAIKDRLARFASERSLLLEDKGYALAMHFRSAPEHEGEVHAEMQLAAALSGGEMEIQPGKMVVELKPAWANKGGALRRLMADPVFSHRRPVAVGDDLTDEGMLAEARAQGGVGIAVGSTLWRPGLPSLADPGAVRRWIGRLLAVE